MIDVCLLIIHSFISILKFIFKQSFAAKAEAATIEND